MTTSTETASDRMSGLSGRLSRLRTGAAAGSLDRWLLIAGAILMPLGIALIVIGWVGASGTSLTYQQNDYLISGGILGLALVVAGGFTYFAYWQTVRIRESRVQAAALNRAIGRLEVLLSGGNVTTPYVATANGTIFHRPDCAAVAGRDDVNAVDVATTTLGPCRICLPLDSA
jgi:cytochrome c biogenesis protein CcdA